MPEIFISYARKDLPVAQWLSESLGREGWDVWWDPEIIPGEQLDEVIQENLTAAKCVIVIWSDASAKSRWVRAEASEAMGRNCLIPASIGNVRLPLPFNQTLTVDLTGWRGDPAHRAYQELVRAVKHILGEANRPSVNNPSVDAKRFSVVVSRILNDIGQQLQEVIAADLAEFEGIYVATLDKTIYSEGQSPERAIRMSADRAQDYLGEMGATIMVWGKILRFSGKEVPQLFLSVSKSSDQRSGRYMPDDELRLPQVFWSDLVDILRLAILTFDADFQEQEGVYLGDLLLPFIGKVRRLLQRADESRGWSRDARGLTRINLANALMLLGSQRGENDPLKEAIQVYRDALEELTREASPRDWARVQNGLGIALWHLGSRYSDNRLLEEAVAAHQSALSERTRENEPLEWAQIHNDLGNALDTLGQREPGTARLEEAVRAYRNALLERTVEIKPLDWAQTQNNLGMALLHLGQRENGTQRLEEALDSLKLSFEVYNRKNTPLDWAQSQNNRGLILWTLGVREGNSERLKSAIHVYREALRERSRKQVPLLWAQTQNNLGLAFWSMGDQTNNISRLKQAARAFRKSLSERTPERSSMDWAQTQNNLGAVLWSLGNRTGDAQCLEESVVAYENALHIYTCAETPLDWAQSQHNLGNALTSLGNLTGDTNLLHSGMKCLQLAIDVYDPDHESALRAQTQGDLGYTAYLIGFKHRDPKYLRLAINSFKRAQAAHSDGSSEHGIDTFEKNIEAIQKLINELDSGNNG